MFADPATIDEEFRKAWLPYFCRSGQREASLEEFGKEVDGWLPLLPEVHLPWLTGQVLADVVRRKGATACSLEGWVWRELKVLPVSWYDELARILAKVEDFGVWPDGLLDAYIAMIPETDGDAAFLGQRPLSALPVVHRIWASARMVQLEEWFKSWVPDSVFSAGGCRGSVVLTGAADSMFIFVADVIKSFDTVDWGFWIGCRVVVGCPLGFVMLILSTTSMFVYGLGLLPALVSPGLVMEESLRSAL